MTKRRRCRVSIIDVVVHPSLLFASSAQHRAAAQPAALAFAFLPPASVAASSLLHVSKEATCSAAVAAGQSSMQTG